MNSDYTGIEEMESVLCCIRDGDRCFRSLQSATSLSRAELVNCLDRLEQEEMILVLRVKGRPTATLTGKGVEYFDRGSNHNAEREECRK